MVSVFQASIWVITNKYCDLDKAFNLALQTREGISLSHSK